MAVPVLSQFLVGLGIDFDDKGAKQATSTLDGLKSTALQLGAVVAGAFGFKALTADFAAANDALGKFAQVFGVLPNDVAALGRAIQHEGGTLETFMSQLEELERFRAGIQIGDIGFLEQAQIAGIDTSQIERATDATEAFIALADQFQRMSQQQRLNAAEALGLDDAAIRLLSKGSAEVRKILAAEQAMRPVTEAMTKEAARFNDEFQDLQTNVGGFADRVSMVLVPAINDAIGGTNRWIDANREWLNNNVDVAIFATSLAIDEFSDTAQKAANVVRFAWLGLTTLFDDIGKSIDGALEIFDKLTEPPDFIKGLFGSEQTTASPPGFAGIPPSVMTPIEGMTVITPSQVRTREESAMQPETRPSSAQRPIVIHNRLELDGQVLDERIETVNNRQTQRALDDIETSTGG